MDPWTRKRLQPRGSRIVAYVQVFTGTLALGVWVVGPCNTPKRESMGPWRRKSNFRVEIDEILSKIDICLTL